MKLGLPKRSPRAPRPGAGGGGRVPALKAPAFAHDLYRDMRDRRLLMPALALMAAIVAIPFLLGSGAAEPVQMATPVVDPDSDQVIAAVLADTETGVREYRKRLKALKRSDPFADKFSASSSSAGAGGLAPPEIPVDPPAPTPVQPKPPSLPGSPAPSSPASSSAPGPTQPAPSGGNEQVIFAPRIDVKFGPVGERKDVTDVKTGELLPDKRKPVVMFIGADEKLETAQFLVSRDVTETNGEGRCRPAKNDCEFLKLKDGDTHYFRYDPDGKRYSLRLSKIRAVEVDRRKVDG